MIYFIFGPDTFRSKQRLNELSAELGANAEVIKLNARELSPASLEQSLVSVSLLSPSRLIIIEDGFANQPLRDYLTSIIKTDLPTGLSLIVYESGNPDKRLALFKTLSKTPHAESFELLAPEPLRRFVAQLAAQHGLTLAPELSQRLVTLVGSDLWRMDQELKKLSAYAQTAPLTPEVVEQLISLNLADDIFGILESISRHQTTRSHGLLTDLIQRGEDPIGVLAVLSWQLRNLIRVHELSRQGHTAPAITKLTGLHPYAVTASLAQLNRLSGRWLTSAYQLVTKLDWRIKQGDIEGIDAADWLIATLSA